MTTLVRLLISLPAVILIQGLTAIGLLLQWAPFIVRTVWQTFVIFISLSCWVYRGLLTWIAVRLGWRELVRQPLRTVISMALSVILMLGLCLALEWPITSQALGIAGGHGLIVGIVWDQVAPPNGQSLGR
jgi:hypothetical protein